MKTFDKEIAELELKRKKIDKLIKDLKKGRDMYRGYQEIRKLWGFNCGNKKCEIVNKKLDKPKEEKNKKGEK